MNAGNVLRLASASPGRSELLRRLGIPFEVAPVRVPEPVDPEDSPWQTAKELSLLKLAAARRLGLPVMTADTVVDMDGVVLGKPADAAEAESMLRRLRGRSHEVYTGVAVESQRGLFLGVATTRVLMRQYTDGEIADYISRGEPFDKAGGYAIQDPELRPVEAIEGSWTNVVGLPLEMTSRLLRLASLEVRRFDEEGLFSEGGS